MVKKQYNNYQMNSRNNMTKNKVCNIKFMDYMI